MVRVGITINNKMMHILLFLTLCTLYSNTIHLKSHNRLKLLREELTPEAKEA